MALSGLLFAPPADVNGKVKKSLAVRNSGLWAGVSRER